MEEKNKNYDKKKNNNLIKSINSESEHTKPETKKKNNINLDNKIYLTNYIFILKPIKNYSLIQKSSLKLRSSIIDWLYIINITLKDDISTFFKGIYLFDLFLSSNEIEIKPNEINLYAAVCYSMSKKINEVVMLSISFVENKILKNKFSKNKIFQSEIDILKKLKFNLNFETVQTFTMFYYNENCKTIPYLDIVEATYKINTCLNIFSLQVLDLIFDMNSFILSFITYVCSCKLLYSIQGMDENLVKDLINHLKFIIGEERFKFLYDKYYDTSNSLFNIINSKKNWLKNKKYFSFFFEIEQNIIENLNNEQDNEQDNENEENEGNCSEKENTSE